MLYEILAETYEVLLQAESLQPAQRVAFYELLSTRLKGEKVRVHTLTRLGRR